MTSNSTAAAQNRRGVPYQNTFEECRRQAFQKRVSLHLSIQQNMQKKNPRPHNQSKAKLSSQHAFPEARNNFLPDPMRKKKEVQL